jgi:hypothetical protein
MGSVRGCEGCSEGGHYIKGFFFLLYIRYSPVVCVHCTILITTSNTRPIIPPP